MDDTSLPTESVVTGELLAEVTAERTIAYAWQRVRRNHGCAGVDGVTIERFEENLDRRLARLRSDLQSGRYRSLPLRSIAIPKQGGGTRNLGVPTVRDRIAQTACLLALEPIIDAELEDQSYAYRRGRSIHHAIFEVKAWRDRGYRWVVDADIDAYFDNVDHALLMETVARYVKDPGVLGLIRGWVEAGVLKNFRLEDLKTGVPQGSPISPLLANLYLDLFDEIMADAGYKLVRYADDFVVLCKHERIADQARADVEALLEEFRLHLDDEKTQVVHFDQGFKYLGAIFVGDLVTIPPAGPRLPVTKRLTRVGGHRSPRQASGQVSPPTRVSGQDPPVGPAQPAPSSREGMDGVVAAALKLAYEKAIADDPDGFKHDPLVLFIETALGRLFGGERSRQMDRQVEGPRLLPMSSLGEYAYCPRLFFYRAVHHLSDVSQQMIAGKMQHAPMDYPHVEVLDGLTRYWAVDVEARRLGVGGRLDLVEQVGDKVYPVEYKRGSGPARSAVRVQLCAEAMALEEVLQIEVPCGFAHFMESDHRERIDFDLPSRHLVLDAIAECRRVVGGRWVPEARFARAKCAPCSLRATCLPWETMRARNLLRRKAGGKGVDDLPDGAGLGPAQA